VNRAQLALAEFEVEFLEHATYAQELQRVLVQTGETSPEHWLEIADLRLAVTVLDQFPSDFRQWQTRQPW
jgi:hypothetical protein